MTEDRDPTRGGRRLARVLGLGLSSLLLGVGAHLAGGGAVPGVGLLVVITVLLGLVATALTRRRCRTPILFAVLIIEQLGLHAVLAAADHAVLVVGGTHAAHAVTVSAPVAGDVMSTSLQMWAAHLIATALTAWLLARGEATLWQLVEVLADLARVRGRRPRPGRESVPAAVTVWSIARLHVAVPRRGPPLSFAV